MTTIIDGTNGITFPDASQQPKSGYGPAFSAYQSVAQSLVSGTPTKLQFQTKEFDTANAFDSTTNYRFQPLVAGYYQISGGFQVATTSGILIPYLYKNGSVYKTFQFSNASSQAAGSALVYLNGSTDYVELWAQQNQATQNTAATLNGTYFQGIFIRGA